MSIESITVTYSRLNHLLSALKFYHLTMGFEFPEHDFDINNTLHGLKEWKSLTLDYPLPLTPRILCGLYICIGDWTWEKTRTEPCGVVTWSLSTACFGRIILYPILIFNINNLTFANLYLKSGSDGQSRASRENYCDEVVPQLLLIMGVYVGILIA
jgi:hypothetical protein